MKEVLKPLFYWMYMKRLTPGEENILLILWKLEEASVKEILEHFETAPAYNTVSTLIRILEKKKFVRHKKVGRGYIYKPIISKESYRDYLSTYLLENYFDSKTEELISYFNRNKKLSELL